MYAAIDVGCTDSGPVARLLGVYSVRGAAETACKDAAYWQAMESHDRHTFVVLDTEEPADYSEFSADEKAALS